MASIKGKNYYTQNENRQGFLNASPFIIIYFLPLNSFRGNTKPKRETISLSFMFNIQELKKVTAMLGTMLTKEEIEEFMAEADKDGNGKLDYEEFVKTLMSY